MDNVPLVEPEASQAPAPTPPPPLIIKADELDATGTDVSTPIPDVSTPITPALQAPPLQPPQMSSPQSFSTSPRAAPARPILRREGSTSAPPAQPPPPTPQQQQQQAAAGEGQQPTDSLSLLQLRRLVTDFPKLTSQDYTSEKFDTRSFAEEVDEWFAYSDAESYLLLRSKIAFETRWKQKRDVQRTGWIDAKLEIQTQFVQDLVDEGKRGSKQVEVVECLAYLALGDWGDTAGLEDERQSEIGSKGNIPRDEWGRIPAGQYTHSRVQIKWMRKGCETLTACGALQLAFDIFRETYNSQEENYDTPELEDGKDRPPVMDRYLLMHHTLSIMYILVEAGRWRSTKGKVEILPTVECLDPSLLQCLTQMIAKTRWEEQPWLPFTKVLLLYWKVILLLFGGYDDLKHSKNILCGDSRSSNDENGEGFITATPLDYHLFRQEITSKYPAYNPPPPLIPIELENNSILPPLPNHPSRRTSQENLSMSNNPSTNGTPGSIFTQPVHIATPAPSPPPSPAGPGGKGGKKQNYQTNQNFPFLYPPLDETSNIVGGKGMAELQDQLVGKRWEGSDIPASIVEAGELFASRMRMSRSIRQLWDVRERFIRHERGWEEVSKDDASVGSSESMIDEDESDESEEKAALPKPAQKDAKPGLQRETPDQDVQRRLNSIESFYSVVLVLWKIVFTNVSHLVSQSNGSNGIGVPNGISFPEDNAENGPIKRQFNLNSLAEDLSGDRSMEWGQDSDPALEELNAVRLRNISSKAISAILILLLKWFKLSHILKFEYMTQLLLDANYLPLILKFLAHQDVDKAADQKIDRDDLSFFHFCHINSSHPPPPPSPTKPPSPSPSSPDSAAPPPIPTHRRSNSTPSSSPPTSPDKPVPEINNPSSDLSDLLTTNPAPSSNTPPFDSHPPTTTTYPPSFLPTTTSLLHLLHLITASHAHRSLLLVQYKSSTILRRYLKLPSASLRLYTLKLLKKQVPFCGRKWRQSNMRVITSVYLNVRGRLRDEWLSGGDVDGVVEEAVPVEQGWRGLVGWWHWRFYREQVVGGRGVGGRRGTGGGMGVGGRKGEIGQNGEEEFEQGKDGEKEVEGGEMGQDDDDDVYNFFARELEKMGWGVHGVGIGGTGDEDDEDDADEEGVGGDGGEPGFGIGRGRGGGTEWDGGPGLGVEGWS
ncbi:MAG: hypothetical protein Q9220_006905 [cf. Caloplaca sp. 1 TL-2023]